MPKAPLTSEQREKRNAYLAIWRAKHRERLRWTDAQRQRYHTNRKKRYAANREALNARRRAERHALRATNPEAYAAQAAKHNAYCRNYRAKSRPKEKQWRQSNPEKVYLAQQRHRAAKQHAPIKDFTPAQWRKMKAVYGYQCVYCGQKPLRLTMDHITPLSKGGNHTYSNIVPACISCNSAKGARKVPLPIQPLLLL